MKKLIFITTIILGSMGISQAALTWSWGGSSGSQDQANAITYAMNTAVGNYNQYANFNGNIQVCYNSGVPTAQTDGYQGMIEFGGSISARVAQHEIGHWMGCGTYSDWNNHRNGNNQWTGAAAIAQLAVYDGWGAVVNADGLHFWPYGWNYDNEGPADRNIGMVCAFRKDMGLSDGSVVSGSTYKIIARNSGKAMDVWYAATANGSKIAQCSYNGGGNQKWVVTDTGGGNYKIMGVQSGKALDIYNANTGDGTKVELWDSWGGSPQQFKFTATSSGNYRITPNCATGSCLDVYYASTSDGADVKLCQWNGGANQQWSFQAP